MPQTQKETVEFDKKFLDTWNTFCDSKGYVKRQAAHACRLAFMELSAEKREEIMQRSTPMVVASRQRNQGKK